MNIVDITDIAEIASLLEEARGLIDGCAIRECDRQSYRTLLACRAKIADAETRVIGIGAEQAKREAFMAGIAPDQDSTLAQWFGAATVEGPVQ